MAELKCAEEACGASEHLHVAPYGHTPRTHTNYLLCGVCVGRGGLDLYDLQRVGWRSMNLVSSPPHFRYAGARLCDEGH
jgi:hypothetical protein